MKTTKTINPLPFESLEPHRFEDLTRQLLYDFRNWKALEATGKMGSDDGFDVRGWENGEVEEYIDDENKEIKQVEDRIWLIQCKREKTVTPKKLAEYLKEIDGKALHGLIFVTACNLSKKTRDIFWTKVKECGIKEAYLWSGSDLEDMLFQPKNDNLLFAYFGISIVIRKRTLKSEIRNKVTIKNKAINYLGEIEFQGRNKVLVRDINDKTYPFIDNKEEFKKKLKWRLCDFSGHYYEGIEVLLKRYFAYLDYDKKEWDCFEGYNDAILHDDWWLKDEDEFADNESRGKVYDYWSNKIDKDKRAWVHVYAMIPYNKIIEIDKYGDKAAPYPHVYIDAKDSDLFDMFRSEISSVDNYSSQKIYNPDMGKRVKIFPKKFIKTRLKKTQE